MTTRLAKEHVPFLVAAMDEKHGLGPHTAPKATHVQTTSAEDIKGPMSIPEPVSVEACGDMSPEDYQKCSLIMAVCTNMVQQTISNAAIDAGVPIADALKNMDAWVTGFTTFPFPFFTFTSQQDDVYQKADFSLKAAPDVVEKIVNIKNVGGLKDAVIGALKNSGGEIARYSKEERDFNYFGVITGYNETNISTRVIKYALHMKNTDTKALCVTYASTELNSSYNTYEFVGDKYMMIKIQEAIQDKLVDKIAEKLLIFIDEFYSKQLEDYNDKVKNIISGT
jgi:hypothetical protein